jgi:hypothetical protein
MDASTGSGGQTEVYGFQPQNSIFATTCKGGFASTNACLWCMEQRPSEDEQRQGRLQGL